MNELTDLNRSEISILAAKFSTFKFSYTVGPRYARRTKKTSHLTGVPLKRTPDKWDFSLKCPT